MMEQTNYDSNPKRHVACPEGLCVTLIEHEVSAAAHVHKRIMLLHRIRLKGVPMAALGIATPIAK